MLELMALLILQPDLLPLRIPVLAHEQQLQLLARRNLEADILALI